ncbi:Hypothetical predicted protein [Podarcis lilfordi]|uniref:Uncharacterized protein n=1 Tax=Podarcis lilfordi TaxID=74358 RepID=A0AA35JSQ8_9SAUR|nr:Hypothetical predicted protein [Podarcis lilfordi]
MPKPARAEISAPRLADLSASSGSAAAARGELPACRSLRALRSARPGFADLSASSGSAGAARGELPACRSLRALRSARPGSRTSPRAAAALPLLAESCRHAEACAR